MIQNPGTPGTPGNSGENDPAVVTFGGPADVLALVSYALGFTPEDSFVVIGLNGNRTGAVLRMDLPPEGDPIAAAAEAHYAAEIISAHHDASLVVLYTDTAPADPNAPFGFIDPSGRDAQDDPRIHSVLREALGIALEAAQAPIRTVWQTGGGYVRDYDCTDITCCPYPGESTDAVKYSQVAAAATLRGNTVDSSPLKRAEAYSTALTPAQRAIAPKVRDLVARLADSQPATQATQDADIAAVYLEAWTEALI
ncbi:MAG: DUF4192 family protein, partial [Brachybacterium sp.]|nr:DUF4192 family protein [Brachybacterium sp.]